MTHSPRAEANEREVRLERLKHLVQIGIDPYPSTCRRTHTCQEMIAQFEVLSRNKTVVFCTGRIRRIREHGGSSFFSVEDASSTIQVYLKKDQLGEKQYGLLKDLDLGDFIEVSGILFKTKTGEITIQTRGIKLLTKALRPLPDKYHGLKNQEERYRKRYLDLIANPSIRETFIKQSAFVQAFRDFYLEHGFIEVKTPVLENVPGGAEAEPFITHHNTLDMDLYLRISLELHLKRLVVGGMEKIFEIGPVFRNEGMSTEHLQEFTMLESYEAYQDRDYLMGFLEDLYTHVIEKIFGSLKIEYRGQILNFERPWPRIDYFEEILKATRIDLSSVSDAREMETALRKNHLELEWDKNMGLGRIIDLLYKKYVRPSLVQPCFLIDHPIQVSPLSKSLSQNSNKVERCQILIAGSEVGNGFSELNDPIEQKRRFEEQMSLREKGDLEAQMMDEDYIRALEQGLPPTAGFGVGLERLFMILNNADSIRDVVLFPTMKEKKQIKKKEEAKE